MSEYDYENDPDIAIAPPKKTIVKEKPLASTGVDSAANYNNPTGYGWNKTNRTWAKYNTPEEGINDSLNRIGGYLSNQGPMSNVVSTPENYVGMWVNGDPKTGSSVQGGSYVKKIRTELANAGIELNKNGSIPNTEQARKAILKAHIVQENAPENQNKFLKVLNTNVSPEDKYDYENDPDISFTPSKQNIEEKPYQPGYYNPNLVQQGENARFAGGGNLAPVVANTAEALKTMSYEDWKKNSLTANLLKAGIMPNPYMLSAANRQEGLQKLGEIGTGLYEAVRHPINTLSAISELKPEEFIPELVKGGIYDL